jgi:hypothetical protein
MTHCKDCQMIALELQALLERAPTQPAQWACHVVDVCALVRLKLGVTAGPAS